MSDDTERPEEASKQKPTTQQEFNLAAMEAIRFLAEYIVEVSKLAASGAGVAAGNARASGNDAEADKLLAQAEMTRKAGLRYHNSALDLWEAFAKDAGPDLIKPRELPPRQNVDD